MIFGVVKLQIIATPEGRKWPVGHTIIIDDEVMGRRLIDEGVAIIHPTVTDPPPTHKCPCEDESNEPCEKCNEKAAQDAPKPKRSRRKAKPKTTSKQ